MKLIDRLKNIQNHSVGEAQSFSEILLPDIIREFEHTMELEASNGRSYTTIKLTPILKSKGLAINKEVINFFHAKLESHFSKEGLLVRALARSDTHSMLVTWGSIVT